VVEADNKIRILPAGAGGASHIQPEPATTRSEKHRRGGHIRDSARLGAWPDKCDFSAILCAPRASAWPLRRLPQPFCRIAAAHPLRELLTASLTSRQARQNLGLNLAHRAALAVRRTRN